MKRMRLDDAFTCSPTESALAAKEPASPTKISYKMNPHLHMPKKKPPQGFIWLDSPQQPQANMTTVPIGRRQNIPVSMLGFTAERIKKNSIICEGTVMGNLHLEQRGPPLCVFLCKLACEVLLPKDLMITELADSPATLQRRIALSSM